MLLFVPAPFLQKCGDEVKRNFDGARRPDGPLSGRDFDWRIPGGVFLNRSLLYIKKALCYLFGMKIVNWAHRGASGHAPENTRAAFKKALEMGADGIECDIRESRDGELVIFHDPTVKRLTGRDGRLNAFFIPELKRLDIGSWFSPSFSGETVLTLAEAIQLLPPPFLLNLEIKAASPQKVVDFIHRSGISDRVVVSSFDHALLGKIRQLDLALPIGVLIDREPWKKAFQQAARLQAISLNVPSKRATEEWMAQAHQKGLKVYLYTVNDPTEMARLIEMGADGLFTNYPDRLSQLQKKTV
jgi:glycerophosphoryl diester phosphodiesterase